MKKEFKSLESLLNREFQSVSKVCKVYASTFGQKKSFKDYCKSCGINNSDTIERMYAFATNRNFLQYMLLAYYDTADGVLCKKLQLRKVDANGMEISKNKKANETDALSFKVLKKKGFSGKTIEFETTRTSTGVTDESGVTTFFIYVKRDECFKIEEITRVLLEYASAGFPEIGYKERPQSNSETNKETKSNSEDESK